VQVTESSLRFGYSFGITSKTVPRSSIRSAQVIPHVRGLRDWGGWGIRLNSSCTYRSEIGCGGGSPRSLLPPFVVRLNQPPLLTYLLAVEWGYISTNGPGIRVTLLLAQPTTADRSTASPSPKGADRVVAYTFLCSDAERVAKILMPSSS
jgi:hypothetical protein